MVSLADLHSSLNVTSLAKDCKYSDLYLEDIPATEKKMSKETEH
jgi:hypothetical protein